MIQCNGNCLECPYPDVPEECLDRPLTYEEHLAAKETENAFIFPKTEKQKRRAARNRRYWERHKEQCEAAVKKWRAENKDHFMAQQREYRDTHREEINARKRAYYAKNIEQFKEKNRRYYANHADRIKADKKELRDANKCRLSAEQLKIRSARKSRGVAVKALAEMLGVSRKTVAAWERGENPANWELLYTVMPELKEMREHDEAGSSGDSHD